MANEKQPLSAGTRIAVVPSPSFLSDNTDLLESRVNARIREIESEAWSAGFKVKIKSVSCGDEISVITYRLDEDPSYRPPM